MKMNALPPNRVFLSALGAAAALLCAAPSPAGALDETTKGLPAPPKFSGEGRPAETVPMEARQTTTPSPGATVQVGTPALDISGVLYEKRRIKRTVPLDPAINVGVFWDQLFATQDGRTVYFDWDDDYLYFAHESANPMDVRIDLDGNDDGWLRGADNLSIQVSVGDGTGIPRASLHRFDTSQDRDRPVWSASPIPTASLKVAGGRTYGGTYALMVAVPRTETIGIERKPGKSFGLRVSSGLLPAPTGETAVLAVRPMLRLTLADSIEAQGGGLVVKVKAEDQEVVPGGSVRLVLEAKNDGSLPIKVIRLFVRGSQSALNWLDAATFTGVTLAPGQKIRRELRSSVAEGAGIGTVVATGGAEMEDGTAIAALAAFSKVEPFAVSIDLDKKPARSGGEKQATRTAVVAVRSRTHDKAKAQVTLQLPVGWTVESGSPTRDVSLAFPGDTRPVFYKVRLPESVAPGEYPLEAAVTIGGRTYSAKASLKVEPGSNIATTAVRPLLKD